MPSCTADACVPGAICQHAGKTLSTTLTTASLVCNTCEAQHSAAIDQSGLLNVSGLGKCHDFSCKHLAEYIMGDQQVRRLTPSACCAESGRSPEVCQGSAPAEDRTVHEPN